MAGHVGETRISYGVSASCDDATLALISLAWGHVRIACERPHTRAQCDALLAKISGR